MTLSILQVVIFKGILWPLGTQDLLSIIPYLAILICISTDICVQRRKLIDIHAMMKRLVRAVEAIPLHLTSAIVRLDDVTKLVRHYTYSLLPTL